MTRKRVKYGLFMLVSFMAASVALSGVVVDLDSGGFSNQEPSRSLSISNLTERTYSFDAINEFLPATTTSVPIYGGASFITDGGEVSGFWAWLGDFTGWSMGKLLSFYGERTGALPCDVYTRSIVLWDEKDFLDTESHAFDNTAESSISVSIYGISTVGAVSAVIRDGDTYYLSETNLTTKGILLVNGENTRWAPFDPNAFTSMVYSSASTGYGITTDSFQSRTFSNVKAVGFIAAAFMPSSDTSAQWASAYVRVDGFTANLKTPAALAPYDAWVAQWTPADVSDKIADYDGDGVKNLAEYALDGNPTNAADKGFVSISVNGRLVDIVHAQHATDTSLTYRLLDGSNLLNSTFNENSYKTGPTLGAVTGSYQMASQTYRADENQKSMFIKVEIVENTSE